MKNRIPKYRIGHPAYAGSNKAFYCNTLREAYVELLARRVDQAQVNRHLRARFYRREGFHFILRNANGEQVEFRRFSSDER